MTGNPDTHDEVGQNIEILDNSRAEPNVPFATRTPNRVSDKGWKLHLNFDPTSADSRFAVQECLQWLCDDNEIAGFKIGNGGGIESGQSGKEATVYIGSYEQLIKVSQLIDYQIGTVLLDHDPNIIDYLEFKIGQAAHLAEDGHPAFGLDTWQDDIPVFSGSLKFFARFDVWPNTKFSEYGIDGVPVLDEINRQAVSEALYGDKKPFDVEDALRKSIEALHTQYGDHFLTEQGLSWYLEMRAEKKLILANHEYRAADMGTADIVARSGHNASLIRDTANSSTRYGRQLERGPSLGSDFR